MALHKRMDVLNTMKDVGVIPVFYDADFETAKQVITACAEGGARVIEFVSRGDRAVNVFTKLREYFATENPDVVLGVGSIVDAPTAALYIMAGADFVVGPVLDEETARVCNLHKVPYSPGCGTATEINQAHALGVEICKVFPGSSVGGPAFVKAVKGPMPWTEIMPTGGVSPTVENLTEWFGAGVACVGMGSKLITKELLEAGDWAGITATVKNVIDTVKTIRGAKV